MEIIHIQSSHSLLTSIIDKRPEGAHSYDLNCRQYLSTFQSWQRHKATQAAAFGLMTLAAERIWITEAECALVSAAIKSAQSPLVLD